MVDINSVAQCCGSKYIEFGSGSVFRILIQIHTETQLTLHFFKIYNITLDPDPN